MSYDDLKNAGNLSIQLAGTPVTRTDADGKTVTDADGKAIVDVPIKDFSVSPTTQSLNASPDPYQTIQKANADKESIVLFVPETGEVLFSDEAYATLETAINGTVAYTDGAGVAQEQQLSGVNTEIRFSYTKDQWENGDLRPEHYFACTGTTQKADGSDNVIPYNQEYLKGTEDKQIIEYDVGYNQKIRVNTTADEVFNQNLDRDIDDLERALSSLSEIDAVRTDLDNILKGMDEGNADYATTKQKYDAADKAYNYIRENMHKLFEGAISGMQGYLDDTNVAITDNF